VIVSTTEHAAGSVRDRLVVALADPQVAGAAGRNAAALVAFHEPMAIFEWLGTGRGLVLLDVRGIPEGTLADQLDHVLGAHEKGLLFVVVAGGGAEVVEVLRDADRRARNRDHLGLYVADDQGVVRHVVGRRLVELEKAARALPATAPLSPEAVEGIVARGRQERLEAMEFVRSTAHRFPHVTVAIIALCFVLFALAAGRDARAQTVFALLCNDPDAVAQGQLWRLLTYALLHDPGNPTHLIVNMISLYSLGGFLEPMLGRWRMAALCAVTALAGGVASTLLTRAISIGASGAVWGLLGATLGLLGRRHRYFPALLARSLRQRLVVLMLINVAISFLPHIDRYCHFGGGLAGYLLALLYARRPAQSAEA
jgi:membrane associated rhomboid family serine protease